jgi:short-subunit dehydrogenase
MNVPPRLRHVAVTGASSGIGAALAQAHAGAGVRLALAGRNDMRLQAVADTCRAKGAQVETTIFDVRQPDRVRDWIVATDARLPLDLVYANAGLGGTYALAGPQGEDGEAARAIVGTNLIGVINTAGPALEVFLARGQGQLVLIGSLAGRLGLPHCPAYSASKAAVAAYADALRRLSRGTGVQVTLVEPGFVRTPMLDGVPSGDLMVWDVAKAAAAILNAVAQRRAVLRFPFAVATLLQLGRWLPPPWIDRILSADFQKGFRP